MADPVWAIFSDVHSNLEALQAVLADMEAQGARRRFCLGDTVGYSANPAQCLELVRSLGCPVIKGNHDAAAANDKELPEMNVSAQAGIEYSRRKLTPAQRTWLEQLPMVHTEGGCEFVHGSLDAPSDWWYVIEPEDAWMHFESQTLPISFCGHSHDPMFWHLDSEERMIMSHGEGRIQLPTGGKTLINVGSVGQPRDGDPNACYVIFNPKARWVEFRRVPYEVAKTRRKILRAKLPKFSAQRLSVGR